MENYGLTKYQINKAHDKLKFNKEFMLSNGVQINNKMIPYADFVQNSYTNSDRYIAELQHRAWSIYEYAKDRQLKNVFFTLTLPSKWHPMRQKSKTDKTMIFNKKFGGRTKIRITTKRKKEKYEFINAKITYKFNGLTFEPVFDFSNSVDKYTPRNASKELSKMLKKLFNERSYRSIENDDRCYFRVTEPHKDGTPHLHISLFVPSDKVDSIVSSLTRLYPAPLGKIETEVNSPVAYLMKYVLKTLDDLRDDTDKITNLTLWYLYHGISRFYTSRTFVSLDVYRKLHGMYTLRELTSNHQMQSVRVYTDTTTKKIVLIENEFGTIYVPKPVNWSEKLDHEDRLNEDKTKIELDSGFEPIYQDKQDNPIELIIDDEEFIYYKGDVKKVKTQPYQMSDLDLVQYFQKIDMKMVNPTHYAHTTNLMIDRGLIIGSRLNLVDVHEVVEVF